MTGDITRATTFSSPTRIELKAAQKSIYKTKMEPNDLSFYPSDPAANQLGEYKQTHKDHQREDITTLSGRPVGSLTNVITAGARGPLLLEDTTLIEEMAHFGRERIPERVVHGKGAGAYGYFEVTNSEITKYCSAAFLSRLGLRTPVAVRFSMVMSERGSTDTTRDIRGFAVKFYTQEGNWDLASNSSPIFFIRDPFFFSRFVHANKRNARTNLPDYNAQWDFFSLRPETIHQIIWMWGDQGIPDGYRRLEAWGANTFKLINSAHEPIYARFHWRCDQGVKNLDVNTANQLMMTDPDYAVHDLYDAIERKQYPSWTLEIQVMTFEQARTWEFNPFDLTKLWPTDEFPEIEVGRMTLDRNPQNYFAEVEQIAFSPANRVRGIEFGPDKVLHARLFMYTDTQRHRLGANFNLLKVNQPIVPVLSPTQRDGPMNTSDNGGAMPNYYPCSFNPGVRDNPEQFNELRSHLEDTDVDRFVSDDEDNYTQARTLYLSYSPDERDRLCTNIASTLQYCYEFVQERMLGHCEMVHPEFAAGVRRAIQTAKQNANANKVK